MQMFRKPVERAMQGDRIGLCVTQFDPDKLERGLVGEISERVVIVLRLLRVFD